MLSSTAWPSHLNKSLVEANQNNILPRLVIGHSNNSKYQLAKHGRETPMWYKFVSLFSTTQKVNDPCGQHIYIQEHCSTFDTDKDK